MPPKQLKHVLIANWGKDWQRAFDRFDVRPIAAASIGQVHRARLRDGRMLAVKVQYPGVARSIDSDVANVGALLRAARILPADFDIAPYLDEARRQLHEETDYLREGGCLSAFRDRLRDRPEFHVPTFYEDWSTQNVPSMSFARGQPIETVQDASQEVRDQVATRLIELTIQELFDFGEVQCDPNWRAPVQACQPRDRRIVTFIVLGNQTLLARTFERTTGIISCVARRAIARLKITCSEVDVALSFSRIS